MKFIQSKVLGALIVTGSMAVAEDNNKVLNHGFEQTDPQGGTVAWTERKPVYHFADKVGRNGSRGLVFENDDPDFYSFPSQKLDVQRGCCYAYEVWVKTENLKGSESGATVCLEWYADNQYLGGAYAEGVCGTSEGWQRVHGVTRLIPTHATRVSVAPYVRKGMTGKAWFDDLKVTRFYPPMISALSASCYRHTVAAGPLTITAGLALDPCGVNPLEVDGAFALKTADGNVVRHARPDTLTSDRAVLKIDASTLPVGEYDVLFTLSRKDGAAKESVAMKLSRVEKLPERKVYIDAHRRLIVENKPFFPLGMYWSGVKDKELDIYAKGPFNCLMPYGSPTTNQMDACYAHGLKVIYSIKDFYSGTRWAPAGMKTEENEVAEIKRRMALHRNHPALIAWYTNDELPVSMVDRLAARQRLMEDLDPDHPTWADLYQYDQIDAYLQTFDVVGTDPYPLPEKPVGMALTWTRSTRDLSYRTRAVWQVPQVFDWGAYRQGEAREKTRAPTLAEMRAMSWQCIAAGANGLVYYSFFDLLKMSDRDPFDTRWADVCAMANEIKRYLPVILSVEPVPTVTCDGPSSVEMRVWRLGDAVYLLVVNGANESVSATLTVSEVFQTVVAEFGLAPENKGDGRLVCKLTPLDPVLLRLSVK